MLPSVTDYCETSHNATWGLPLRYNDPIISFLFYIFRFPSTFSTLFIAIFINLGRGMCHVSGNHCLVYINSVNPIPPVITQSGGLSPPDPILPGLWKLGTSSSLRPAKATRALMVVFRTLPSVFTNRSVMPRGRQRTTGSAGGPGPRDGTGPPC